jgi:hypothetical protein
MLISVAVQAGDMLSALHFYNGSGSKKCQTDQRIRVGEPRREDVMEKRTKGNL